MPRNELIINDVDIIIDINNNTDNLNTQNGSTNDSQDSDLNREKNVVICGKSLNMTKSQFITIVLLSTYYIISSSYYSLLAPFLPAEALKKEISETQIGIIFGIFELVLLLLSPIFGKYIHVFGVRFLFVSGLFLSSGSEILFGLLDMCPNGLIYFVMCIACRSITAVGSSMGLSYAIVGYYFPDSISKIVAMLEVFNGIGLMVGPILGGFLFEIGGFRLPFFFMGGLLFLVFLISFFIFPDIEHIPGRTDNSSSSVHTSSTLSIMPLLKTPRFLLTMQMLFVGSVSIGFIEPSIQVHLAPLNLRPIELGSILFFPALLYIITTPIVGYFCDKYKRSRPFFMFVSALISAVSFSFFGPLPWLNLPLKLSIFLSGFIAFGLSIGGLTIPVYSELTKIALAKGYPNDIRTQGLISGTFSSVWSFGALVGPIIGGIVVDKVGFSMASFGIVILFLITDVIYGLFNAIKYFTRADYNQKIVLESDELDDDDSPLLNA